MRARLGVFLSLVLAGSVGCGARSFRSAIRAAPTPTLYEGLPHQTFEATALEREKKEKATVDLHGYPFYRDTITLSEGDAQALTAILSESGSFRSFSGEKKCGGFHPDYAVRYTRDGKHYEALLCFGCDEAKLFGPGIDARYDVDSNAQRRIEDMLAKYRQRSTSSAAPPVAAE
jgi:hypothetical protein